MGGMEFQILDFRFKNFLKFKIQNQANKDMGEPALTNRWNGLQRLDAAVVVCGSWVGLLRLEAFLVVRG